MKPGYGTGGTFCCVKGKNLSVELVYKRGELHRAAGRASANPSERNVAAALRAKNECDGIVRCIADHSCDQAGAA